MSILRHINYLLLSGFIFIVGLILSCGSPYEQNSVVQVRTDTIEAEVVLEVEDPLNDRIDETVKALMKKHLVAGVSIALLENNKLNATHHFGEIQFGKEAPITEKSMFSVGSISKVVNAVLVLRLVQEGKLQLDEDINKYLTNWKVEESKYTKDNPVTLRRILSHTAGFTVHGFGDYLPHETLPNTLQILNGDRPAKNRKVYVNIPVGSQYRYSGGGITVIQHIIEEVTGLAYHEAAQKILFDPLQLKRTTYENPVPASFGEIAKAHNGSGRPTALPRGYQSMPEMAASGLWTTPSELSTILSLLIEAHKSKSAPFISAALIEDMISPEKNSEYGLGPKISKQDNETIVSHGGANDSYRALFKIFWNKGTGFVIFTNGQNGRALINELTPILDKLVFD